MDKRKAQEILGHSIRDDKSICSHTNILHLDDPKTHLPYMSQLAIYDSITLDGEFDLGLLKAIVWWMENEQGQKCD